MLGEFEDSEAHIDGLVDGYSDLLHIESHQVIVEDANPLTLRFP